MPQSQSPSCRRASGRRTGGVASVALAGGPAERTAADVRGDVSARASIPARSRRGSTSCSVRRTAGRRARKRPELVPAPAVLRRRGHATGSPASRSGSAPTPPASRARSTTLEPGEYAVQAVVRLNPDTHQLGDGEGNAYGPVVRARARPRVPSGTVALTRRPDRPARAVSGDRPGQARRASPARSCRRSTAGRSATARR